MYRSSNQANLPHTISYAHSIILFNRTNHIYVYFLPFIQRKSGPNNFCSVGLYIRSKWWIRFRWEIMLENDFFLFQILHFCLYVLHLHLLFLGCRLIRLILFMNFNYRGLCKGVDTDRSHFNFHSKKYLKQSIIYIEIVVCSVNYFTVSATIRLVLFNKSSFCFLSSQLVCTYYNWHCVSISISGYLQHQQIDQNGS